MLVLAPDPRLGIAPERIARVRALLDSARLAEGPASGTTIPGVVVALPGGPDGVLDAVVLRPDGVLGLVPTRTRVAAGSTRPVDSHPTPPRGESRPDDADDGTDHAAVDELERLLALPDPPVTAPRRALPAEEPGPEETRSALVAPVGSLVVLGPDDVRRILDAFRLGEHVPDASELATAGFVAPPGDAASRRRTPEDDDAVARTAALPATSELPEAGRTAEAPSAPAIPRARRAPSGGSRPSLPPVPVTEPVPQMGRNPERDAVAGGTASFPATGALAGGPERGPRWTIPPWAQGWPGVLAAAVLVFLVALGAAFGIGRLVGVSSGSDDDGVATPTRTVDGVALVRRDATLDTTCAGHAYGRVVQYVRDHPCQRLERSLWSGPSGGHGTFVAVATVRMTDAGSASALKSLIDTSGTGNIAELVRERSYPGAPTSFTSAGYASQLRGDQVVIAEADGADSAAPDAASLNRLAAAALALG